MKKIFLSMIMIIGLMSLAACGNDNAPNTEPSLAPANNASLAVSEENSTEPAEDTKSLVVYFSWSGNTENVAKCCDII